MNAAASAAATAKAAFTLTCPGLFFLSEFDDAGAVPLGPWGAVAKLGAGLSLLAALWESLVGCAHRDLSDSFEPNEPKSPENPTEPDLGAAKTGAIPCPSDDLGLEPAFELGFG